jgi:hypothetical protein
LSCAYDNELVASIIVATKTPVRSLNGLISIVL